MTADKNLKPDEIDETINENLKQVYAELAADQMPDQIIDLLAVLRAQDLERQDKK